VNAGHPSRVVGLSLSADRLYQADWLARSDSKRARSVGENSEAIRTMRGEGSEKSGAHIQAIRRE
jgi:hypothetical protein